MSTRRNSALRTGWLHRQRLARRGATRGVLVFVLIGAALLVTGFLAGRNVELLALGAGCLVNTLVLGRSSLLARRIEIREEGVVLPGKPEPYSWQEVTGCWLGGYSIDPERAEPRELTLGLEDRIVPIRCDSPRETILLYRQICQNMVDRISPALSPALHSVRESELLNYPPELVIAAGTVRAARSPASSGRLFLTILVLLGSAIAGGMAAENPLFSIVAGVTLAVMLVAIGLFRMTGVIRRRFFRGYSGGLVISPSKLAAQLQGLQGELKWGELKSLELKPSTKRPGNIRLHLDGVSIDLPDQYQLPLWYLYRQMSNFAGKYGREISRPLRNEFAETAEPAIEDGNPFRPPRNR